MWGISIPLVVITTFALSVVGLDYDRVSVNDLKVYLGKHLDALRLVSRALPSSATEQVKIFCWVNTYEANHKKQAQRIKDTWGQYCDKLVFMSNVEDPDLPAVEIVAPPTHESLWDKHRGVLEMIYQQYYGEYEWFLKCDDDAFVLMENLKNYLASSSVQLALGNSTSSPEPILLGHRMTLPSWELMRHFNLRERKNPVFLELLEQSKIRFPEGLIYTPGGGGYVMNWSYLKLLTESLYTPQCLPGTMVPDDWAISFCMVHAHGVVPFDTRDSEKRERVHQYSPKRVFHMPYEPEAYDHAVHLSIYQESNWFSDHRGIGWRNGTGCCAPDSISFHYVKGERMNLFYYFFYQGGKERIVNAELSSA